MYEILFQSDWWMLLTSHGMFLGELRTSVELIGFWNCMFFKDLRETLKSTAMAKSTV